MKDPRVPVTFGDLVEPYYNSLTLDCYSLPDSGTKKSQEVKLNFTGSVVDLQINGSVSERLMYAVKKCIRTNYVSSEQVQRQTSRMFL